MANRYSTNDVPEMTALRHVLVELGVNRKVDLRTSTQRIKGRIQSLGSDSFTIAHGLRSRTEEVRFNEVREIKPAGLSGAAKAGIVAGAAVGGLLLLLLQCYMSTGCAS